MELNPAFDAVPADPFDAWRGVDAIRAETLARINGAPAPGAPQPEPAPVIGTPWHLVPELRAGTLPPPPVTRAPTEPTTYDVPALRAALAVAQAAVAVADEARRAAARALTRGLDHAGKCTTQLEIAGACRKLLDGLQLGSADPGFTLC